MSLQEWSLSESTSVTPSASKLELSHAWFSGGAGSPAIDLGSPVLRPTFRSAFPLGLTLFLYGAI